MRQYQKPEKHVATITDALVLNEKIIEVILKVDGEFIFEAGQFISLNVGNGVFRSYSIASSPKETPLFSLLVSVGHRGIGSNYIKSLKIGDKVEFIGPSGRFCLPEKPANNLVFIVTGTGLAPIIPMLYKLVETQTFDHTFFSSVKLLFGIRDQNELFKIDLLEWFKHNLVNFEYELYFSQSLPTESDTNMFYGRVTNRLDTLIKEFHNKNSAQYFLCGNPNMVSEVLEILRSRSIESNLIFHEKFTVSIK